MATSATASAPARSISLTTDPLANAQYRLLELPDEIAKLIEQHQARGDAEVEGESTAGVDKGKRKADDLGDEDDYFGLREESNGAGKRW